MITLRVVLDEMLLPGGIARYTEELTRELIRTAPRECEVAGLVSASPQSDYDKITTLLPGLADLYKTTLARRELTGAWTAGLYAHHGNGMIHAPSLLAPLHKHDRLNDLSNQTVVTIHDASAWTHPETLDRFTVATQKALAKRARKYADAIVVPSHAVADQLQDVLKVGDRMRVIGGAVGSRLQVPVDGDARASAMGLPAEYILTAGTANLRKGLGDLIAAMADPAAPDIPLLVVGPGSGDELDIAIAEHDLGPDKIRVLGTLDDADLAVVMDRAAIFVHPGVVEGFGLPLLEALHFGTPVVHADAPALVEVAAGSGMVVPVEDRSGYPARLAAAMSGLLGDAEERQRLSVIGRDRARVFSWRDSAEKVWQLHADL